MKAEPSISKAGAATSSLVVGLDHLGITVGCLEDSLAFYRDLLGMTVVSTTEGEDVGSLVGVDGARIRAADIDAGHGRVLELVEYTKKAGARVAPRSNRAGSVHLSLQVLDVNEVLDHLAAAGYSARGSTVLLTEGKLWSGAAVAYVTDPDGVAVELIERPDSATTIRLG